MHQYSTSIDLTTKTIVCIENYLPPPEKASREQRGAEQVGAESHHRETEADDQSGEEGQT